jgi:aryl-alcohol dehydrogenase-like predicted oxidoreductase
VGCRRYDWPEYGTLVRLIGVMIVAAPRATRSIYNDPTMTDLTRRDFVKACGATAAGLVLGSPAAAAPMPDRPLGRTGHQVRLFSLGGQATLERPEKHDEALRIINRAIDLGVNYLDTAPKYGSGVSQSVIGEVMATRRKEVFLASKTHERGSRDKSLKLLEQSLRLLRTDYLDLWQIHNVREDEHLDRIFGKDGCLEALTRARDEKMVRFLGITGHYDPVVLATAIQRFDFDCILMPVNPADRHPLLFIDRWVPHANRNRLSFLERLLPVAQAKRMGIIGMKIPAHGRLFRPDGVSSMQQALGYALSQPVSTVIVGCDTVSQLEQNIALAAAFQPLPSAELARLEAATAHYPHEAAWFKRGGNQAANDQQ